MPVYFKNFDAKKKKLQTASNTMTFKMSINMGKNGLFRDFGCDMIVALVSFQKKLISWDFPPKPSLELTENALKRGKNIH